MILPKAKLENIVVNTLKDEVLIYDLSTNQAVCLNSTSANVFNACDGKTSFNELKSKYGYPEDLIYLALDKLKEQNLLEGDYVSPFVGLSRREVIRKVGLASMIALPVIAGIVAPTAAAAASFAARSRAQGQTCNTTNECADNGATCNNLNNNTRVCCRSGATGQNAPGTTFIGIFANCNSCAASSAAEFCCSGMNSYTGTCTTQNNGTGNCQYRCG